MAVMTPQIKVAQVWRYFLKTHEQWVISDDLRLGEPSVKNIHQKFTNRMSKQRVRLHPKSYEISRNELVETSMKYSNPKWFILKTDSTQKYFQLARYPSFLNLPLGIAFFFSFKLYKFFCGYYKKSRWIISPCESYIDLGIVCLSESNCKCYKKKGGIFYRVSPFVAKPSDMRYT